MTVMSRLPVIHQLTAGFNLLFLLLSAFLPSIHHQIGAHAVETLLTVTHTHRHPVATTTTSPFVLFHLLFFHIHFVEQALEPVLLGGRHWTPSTLKPAEQQGQAVTFLLHNPSPYNEQYDIHTDTSRATGPGRNISITQPFPIQ